MVVKEKVRFERSFKRKRHLRNAVMRKKVGFEIFWGKGLF